MMNSIVIIIIIIIVIIMHIFFEGNFDFMIPFRPIILSFEKLCYYTFDSNYLHQ